MSVKINRVYTRTGDGGDTSLVGGQRVKKSDLRVEAYGAVDEANCALGFAKDYLEEKTIEIKPVIERLQQELFDVGGQIATPCAAYGEGMWHVEERHITKLEELCDVYGEELPELPSFVLPGGTKACSCLHLARVAARKAERAVVCFNENSPNEKIDSLVVGYLNRLSDLLFIFSRWAIVKQGGREILWAKEDER